LIVILPALWVSLEFLRGALFTGFPWGILGYTQYKNPVLIQIADMTGAYGLSFVIIMANLAVYSYLNNSGDKRIRRYQAVTFIIVLIAVITYGYLSLKRDDLKPGLRVSVVQGNIEQARKWDPYYKDHILATYEGLTKEAAGDRPGLIIWPETSVPGFLGEKDIDQWLKKTIRHTGIPLFLGAATYEFGPAGEEEFLNSAVLFSEHGDIVKRYYKIHLVPLGEYVPFERHFPFIRDFIDVPIGDYKGGEELTVFVIETEEGDGLRCSVLICFEDIFSGLARSFVLNGADFLVNMTNDAWFKESGEQLQHTQASVFRAVENRVSVVRAANTGFSCYINPKGMIEASIRDPKTGSMYVPGFKTFTVKAGDKNTFYTKYGDIFAYMCIFLVLGTLSALALGHFPLWVGKRFHLFLG
jgi:apolipoprotein N-acyltransferase